MLCVSWRLLACSLPISSCRLTSADSEVTCLSSSILASSSAMGCSKSRNETAMRRRGYVRRGPERKLASSAAVGGEHPAGGRRRRPIEDLDRAAPHQALELLEELPARAHAPLGTEIQRAAGARTRVLDRHRAWPRAPWLEDAGEPVGEARQLAL